MSFFSFGRGTREVFGAIFEIGSGSVLTAIVHSVPEESQPQIIWSHREHAPLRNVDSLDDSAKAVMSALLNASIELETVGRQALNEYQAGARISKIQASISAPWSYTVSKTVNYNQDYDFLVSQELIDELLVAAQAKVKQDLQSDSGLQELGLSIIAETTMDSLANGYRVENAIGEKTKSFTLTRASVVAQQYLIDALNDTGEKMFANVPNHKLSFILMFYFVAHDILPKDYDVCLLDITYEATEIGVVRDGSLTYSTHTPFGSFSLAREIAAVTNVPLHEAFGYMHTEKPFSFLTSLTPAKKEEVELIFEKYIEKLTALFHETGDTLSIPKRIVLHSDLKSEPFYLNLIEKAAKRSIKSSPIVTLASKEILKQTFDPSSINNILQNENDTALLVSALFFHKHHNTSAFQYR